MTFLFYSLMDNNLLQKQMKRRELRIKMTIEIKVNNKIAIMMKRGFNNKFNGIWGKGCKLFLTIL